MSSKQSKQSKHYQHSRKSKSLKHDHIFVKNRLPSVIQNYPQLQHYEFYQWLQHKQKEKKHTMNKI